MIDAYQSIYWTNVLILGFVGSGGGYFILRNFSGIKLSTILPVILLIFIVYLIYFKSEYAELRREFDTTKEEVVLKVISTSGLSLESSDGEQYLPKRGSIGIKFIYLFKANIRPEIGSCVRVEFNYINKRTSYTYINFGSIYEADCDGLMSSHEVSSAGGDAMKKKWHYRRSRG